MSAPENVVQDQGDYARIIGWRERVDLPEWGLAGIRAKMDTGARTCALDVAAVEMIGEDRVRFEVVRRVRPQRRTVWVEAPVARVSRVRPTTGEVQVRPVCMTRLRIGEVEREVEIGLVPREGMLCRMLVGRTALAGAFRIDPARTGLLRNRTPDSRRKRP